ncbi:YIP1 family protein [Melghirimyces thermohalophilus]|nr:YIP1 family protein [Melghirimyces thermohalophilus]
MAKPWIRIWIHPRSVIREALIHSERKQEWLLILLFGLMLGLKQASLRSLGDALSFSLILILSLVLGPLLGALAWYIVSGIAYGVGRWLDGTASWEEIQTAVAWASIPFSMKLVLWIPQLAFFGQEMFTTTVSSLEGSAWLWVLYTLLTLIDSVISIWYFVVLCKGVGQAHDFSAWRGFFSLLIGWVILLVPFILLAVLFRRL